jgi:hypothetical protein
MSTERPADLRPVDDAVDQAWRAASTDEPGPGIDAAILAAARAEAERASEQPAMRTEPTHRPRPTMRAWWTGWQPLAAAATVAGLAFVLVQTMPRDRDVEPQLELERSTPAPAATESRAAEDTAIPQYESPGAMEAPAPAAPVPPPSQEPPEAARDEATASAPAESEEAAPAGGAAQADAEFGESRRATKAATYPPPPAAWVARIEELFESGDRVAAAEELRAFRAAYTDADRHLPEKLRDWATTVK